MTTGDALTARLEASERFDLVWREPPISILAVRPRPGQPDPVSLVDTDAPSRARLERADPERLRIHFDASRATRASVAIAWSPKWDGSIDGRDVHLDRTRDGLIALRLRAGATTLELSHGSDIWDRVGVAISAATVVFLMTFAASEWSRRRKRRTG